MNEEVFNKMRDLILQLESENDNLARGYALVESQRDEARREVCCLVSELDSLNHIATSVEQVAEEYGWDCFKENNNARG